MPCIEFAFPQRTAPDYCNCPTKPKQTVTTHLSELSMPRQPKVAIYARVSTDEQSPDAQLRDLREYVRARGWE